MRQLNSDSKNSATVDSPRKSNGFVTSNSLKGISESNNDVDAHLISIFTFFLFRIFVEEVPGKDVLRF